MGILSLSPPILSATAKTAFTLTHTHRRIRLTTMSASSPSPESSQAPPVTDDVVVQYVVLRRDLINEWPMGSVVSQGCHASVAAIWQYKDDPHTLLYCSPSNLPSMHKVTLEVKGEIQMVSLSEKLKDSGILHYLWIEQPENFPTCLATKPYPKSLVSPFFKKLKLSSQLLLLICQPLGCSPCAATVSKALSPPNVVFKSPERISSSGSALSAKVQKQPSKKGNEQIASYKY